jgi:AraC family L-rhamnose operon regulatory protein RhaS
VIKQNILHIDNIISNLTGYIKTNIYTPEKLGRANLAEIAGVAKTYVGEYFKRQTGKSIRSFILAYRLNLVKIRLQFTDLSISQIAHELCFSDESHLSNLFKKHCGESPTNFRKSLHSASENLNKRMDRLKMQIEK